MEAIAVASIVTAVLALLLSGLLGLRDQYRKQRISYVSQLEERVKALEREVITLKEQQRQCDEALKKMRSENIDLMRRVLGVQGHKEGD